MGSWNNPYWVESCGIYLVGLLVSVCVLTARSVKLSGAGMKKNRGILLGLANKLCSGVSGRVFLSPTLVRGCNGFWRIFSRLRLCRWLPLAAVRLLPDGLPLVARLVGLMAGCLSGIDDFDSHYQSWQGAGPK